MRRLLLRVLMALIGLSLFVLYASVAVVGYQLFVSMFERRPSLLRIVAYFLLITVTVGYLSYRLGTAGLLRNLDAVEIAPVDLPWLYSRIERIASTFDVRDVSLYATRMDAPNALAIGTARGGAIVLDVGLFRLLTASELETIVAYELVHLEGRNGLVQTIGYTAVRTVGGVCYLLLLPVALLVGGSLRALSLLRGERPRPFLEHLALVQWRVTQTVVVALFAVTLLLRANSRPASTPRTTGLSRRREIRSRSLARSRRSRRPRCRAGGCSRRCTSTATRRGC